MANAKALRDRVVVVTGASSGIGRATAIAFARQGAAVVLAARREWALREAAESCERNGVPTLVVPTDTTDEAAVKALADRAVEKFGRIDVWVNNAGVGHFARFEDAPADEFRRVIETNFFGYVHGARAVLPRFYEQGHGVLINNASVLGKAPGPYASAYTASKHAIVAFSESLRQEALLAGATGVHVCAVLPATIDTPFFRHAGNHTGRALKAMPPVYSPWDVADAIVGLAVKPRREVTVGAAGKMMEAGMAGPAQGSTEKALAAMVDRQMFADGPAPHTPGILYEPMDAGSGITDGWDGVPGRGGQSPAAKLVAAAALAAVPAALAWLNRKPAEANGNGNGHAAGNGTGSHGGMTERDLLVAWLDDALAMELALTKVLQHRIADAKAYPWVAERDRQHLEETRRHAEMVRARLTELGATPSAAKSVLGTVFGAMQAPMTGVARDEIVKNFLVDHAAEQFEVASYRALVAAAREVGDEATAAVCEQILREDEAMAAWIADNTPRIVRERMRELAGVSA